MARLRNVFLLSVLCAAVLANNKKVLEGRDVVKGEYLVALKNVKSEADLDKFRTLVSNVDTAVVRRTYKIGRENFALVKLTNLEKINEVSHLEFVDYVESNGVVKTGDHLDFKESPIQDEVKQRRKRSTGGGTQEHCTASYMNGDSSDWGAVRTSHRNLPDALSAPYIHGNDDGEGVDVYVVDTGVYLEHDDFEGRASYGMIGESIAGRGEGEADENGHGTHIAGIAAGKRYGIARKANIISCKVIGANGLGDWSDVIHAMEWIVARMQWQKAVGETPRAVVTISLMGEDLAYAAISAIQAAIDEGAVVSLPAGNINIDACYFSPARLATALTVAASNDMDEFASFSNFGPCINIIAPGREIAGPFIGYNTRYIAMSGTTQAAAIVAGIAARHLSMYDDHNVPTSMEVRADIIDQTSRGMIDLPGDAIGSTPNHMAYKACDSNPKPMIAKYVAPPEETVEEPQVPFEWPDIPECPPYKNPKWPNDTIYAVLLGVLILVCFALLQHIMLIVGLLRIKSRCKEC